MKQITIRIYESQYEELTQLANDLKINNVSLIIRLALDDYLQNYDNYLINLERRKNHEYDEYKQKQRFSNIQKNSSFN